MPPPLEKARMDAAVSNPIILTRHVVHQPLNIHWGFKDLQLFL